jgi:hypothetical protein
MTFGWREYLAYNQFISNLNSGQQIIKDWVINNPSHNAFSVSENIKVFHSISYNECIKSYTKLA